MLAELVVRDLGVIDELAVVLEPGMTALTGETGAGKTMVVEAIALLLGGRADAAMVRTGASDAVVEGRFVTGESEEDEVILRRVVPSQGRSRSYIDGQPATAAALAELGRSLVDLHGQHDHQSLLSASVQRAALDRYGEIDLAPLVEVRREQADIEAALVELGGDERARARELDLYRFQLDELEAAAVTDAGEDDRLQSEEATLGDALAHREAGWAAGELIGGDGPVIEQLSMALGHLADRAPFAAIDSRLRASLDELREMAAELRAITEGIEDDPERLAELQRRREQLTAIRRKYGESLDAVMAYHEETAKRLADLESHDERAAALDENLRSVQKRRRNIEKAIGAARREVAPALADAVEPHLAELAMATARLAVEVGDDDPGDDVQILLAASSGARLAPLTKVASGGELARSMLALRLVLTAGPPTLVFDEVDAGIGGEAATAVGRSLAQLGADHQVLVVTHLPQVAAAADQQVQITKHDDGKTTRVEAARLDHGERTVEISRMLSGSPESKAARKHAAELLSR